MSIRHDALGNEKDCNVIMIRDGNRGQFIIDTSRSGDCVKLAISKYTADKYRSDYIAIHLLHSEFDKLAEILQTIAELSKAPQF